jgi:hypothetical protein
MKKLETIRPIRLSELEHATGGHLQPTALLKPVRPPPWLDQTPRLFPGTGTPLQIDLPPANAPAPIYTGGTSKLH